MYERNGSNIWARSLVFLLALTALAATAGCRLPPFDASLSEAVSGAEDDTGGSPSGPGVTVTPANVSATEGGANGTYTVVLDTAPANDVVVSLTGGGQISVSPTPLTFTTADWDSSQTVVVTANDDGAAEGNHTDTVTHTVSSSDVDYNGISASDVSVSITDNDVPGVSVSPTTVSVTEGGATATYDVVLTTLPTADVDITIAPGGGEVTVAPTSLTFTTANWASSQTVTVTATDDANSEGPHNEVVTHTATSVDPGYDGIAIGDVTAAITDNDLFFVTYNGNASTFGTAPTDATAYLAGDMVTTLANTGGLVQNGAVFTGWNTAADGSGTSYPAGSGTFTITGDTTLYAEWDTSNNGFAVGLGTAGDPYQVATPEHLSNVRNDLSAEYVQTADIDLNVPPWNAGTGWEPIGTPATPFTGTFDGQGFAVANLTVDRPATDHVGLFGFAEDTTLNNVELQNVNVTGREYVGALLGESGVTSSFVNDVSVSGTISSSGGNYIGGLIGWYQNITTQRVYGDVTIACTGACSQVGGLIGRLNSGQAREAFVEGTIEGDDDVGGVVGYLRSVLRESYSLAAVTASTGRAGGVAGYSNGVLRSSYASGSVTGPTAGGLIGDDAGTLQLAPVFEDSLPDNGVGTALTATEMQDLTSYPSWDIDTNPISASVWTIDDGSSFPYFGWQPPGTGSRPP